MPRPTSPTQPTPTCTKRLHTELKSAQTSPSPSIPSLGPISDSSLLHWRAILLGPPDTPYSSGIWELSILIPANYPYQPPVIKFVTPVCHPNIAFPGGEVCLDLLRSDGAAGDASTGAGASGSGSGSGTGGDGMGAKGAWSPAYTIVKCLEAIQDLLRYPEPDSPLNVDVARLLKGGDRMGWESLVRFWCREFRAAGPAVGGDAGREEG